MVQDMGIVHSIDPVRGLCNVVDGNNIPGSWFPNFLSVTVPFTPSIIMAYVPFITFAPNPTPYHASAGPS